MSGDTPLSESSRGYLSETSKRRFTIVAGVLGAFFFLAQIVLPVAIVFLLMFPAMFWREITHADMSNSVIWNNEIWYTESGQKADWRPQREPQTTVRLKHASPSTLAEAEDSVRIVHSETTSGPALLPQGDRLWVIGNQEVGYYQSGVFTALAAGKKPRNASRPFLYRNRPAVLTTGRARNIAELHVDGDRAEWRAEPFSLDLPSTEQGSFCQVQIVQAGERLYVVADTCDTETDRCSLWFREMGSSDWKLVVDDTKCIESVAAAQGDRLAIVLSQTTDKGRTRFAVVTSDASGASTRQEIGELEGRFGWRGPRALPYGRGLLLVSDGRLGTRRLVEIVDGRITRSVKVKESFPFGTSMALLMMVPQSVPFLLSLILAFILTLQMRKHRVQEYSASGRSSLFASLWQRALAQAVDAVFLALGAVAVGVWMWRQFSDPERIAESDISAFVFFGLLALALLWMIAVLVIFSFLEGRWGKTPGKWLLGIRVLGTDLQPCGFWRALVRNLLTFVDGFFNFLVGILLVALTEHWQRLGDLAARTLVVVDGKTAAP